MADCSPWTAVGYRPVADFVIVRSGRSWTSFYEPRRSFALDDDHAYMNMRRSAVLRHHRCVRPINRSIYFGATIPRRNCFATHWRK